VRERGIERTILRGARDHVSAFDARLEMPLDLGAADPSAPDRGGHSLLCVEVLHHVSRSAPSGATARCARARGATSPFQSARRASSRSRRTSDPRSPSERAPLDVRA
jgi:hypothetical protein